jgi:hypothetical protein
VIFGGCSSTMNVEKWFKMQCEKGCFRSHHFQPNASLGSLFGSRFETFEF